MELNAQIKKYRMKQNLSQEELAEKVYVTRQTISNWENAKSYPDIHSLLLLSSFSDYDSGCCAVVLLAGSVRTYSTWNMVCDNDVLGDKSRKNKKEKRCADIQGNCCFYGRKETG